MIPDITNWNPCPIEAIQNHLGDFHEWCLCGGQSLDWILRKTTRQHGDTDIGVYRSDLRQCLEAIGISRVFLCDPPGSLTPWDGSDVPSRVHDIWITSRTGNDWLLQVMVYDDGDEHVVYRRDPRIQWSKASHALAVRGVNVLNPVVTALFKTHRAKLEDKDCQDIQTLIEGLANEVH